MGLYVSVFKNIKPVDDKKNARFRAYVIDERWEWKIKNLIKGQYYTGDMVARKISYPCQSHMDFRVQLIKLIGRTEFLDGDNEINFVALPDDMPFIDLIDFADNEGSLDFEVCGKIHKDFLDWQMTASVSLSKYDFDLYLNWMETFNLGKDNGVVVFH